MNFTSASKTENNGNDVTIKNADSSLYNPYTGLAKIKDYVYKYTVDSENSGNKNLRFWRGNEETLWNCSNLLEYSDYTKGKNCVKVTGWTNSGELVTYDENEDSPIVIHINTDDFGYNDQEKWYLVNSKIEKLSGTVSNIKNVEKMTYKIKDINGNVVKSGSITV